MDPFSRKYNEPNIKKCKIAQKRARVCKGSLKRLVPFFLGEKENLKGSIKTYRWMAKGDIAQKDRP